MRLRASEGLWESLMRSEGTLESVDKRMLAVISASLHHMTRLLVKT